MLDFKFSGLQTEINIVTERVIAGYGSIYIWRNCEI